METTNVIIVTMNGILENPIVCNCPIKAELIYIAQARKLGVIFDEDEIENLRNGSSMLTRIVEQIEGDLENTGNEIKWFEVNILK